MTGSENVVVCVLVPHEQRLGLFDPECLLRGLQAERLGIEPPGAESFEEQLPDGAVLKAQKIVVKLWADLQNDPKGRLDFKSDIKILGFNTSIFQSL